MHFVREKIENKEVEIRYVPSLHQVADIFTKGLSRDRLQFLCAKLGLQISPICSHMIPNMCSNNEGSKINLQTNQQSFILPRGPN